VRAVVVEDDVDGFACRNLPFDLVEEADKLLVPVALHVLPDDRSVEHVERGKERCRAVALVVVGHGLAAPLLQLRPSWPEAAYLGSMKHVTDSS